MKISGDITLPASREAVFDKLKDAPFFASCVDGVQEMKEIDATHYDAVLETKVAYMTFRFKVSVEVTRLSRPDAIEAKIEGTPLGIVGRMTAVSTTRLFDDNGGTRVTYDIDADASRADLEAILAQSQKRSAVFDIITNPTTVQVSLA